MPKGVLLAKAELLGDEQLHGRELCDVFDSGGGTAHAVSAGAFCVQSEHDTVSRLCGTAWDCAACWIGKGIKALAVKTLWLQELVRDRGLQIKSVSPKANKADLVAKVLPVARLNALLAS